MSGTTARTSTGCSGGSSGRLASASAGATAAGGSSGATIAGGKSRSSSKSSSGPGTRLGGNERLGRCHRLDREGRLGRGRGGLVDGGDERDRRRRSLRQEIRDERERLLGRHGDFLQRLRQPVVLDRRRRYRRRRWRGGRRDGLGQRRIFGDQVQVHRRSALEWSLLLDHVGAGLGDTVGIGLRWPSCRTRSPSSKRMPSQGRSPAHPRRACAGTRSPSSRSECSSRRSSHDPVILRPPCSSSTGFSS